MKRETWGISSSIYYILYYQELDENHAETFDNDFGPRDSNPIEILFVGTIPTWTLHGCSEGESNCH